MAKQKNQTSEAAVREIRRRTRRKFSPEEKIRIVLEGLRGEEGDVAGMCADVAGCCLRAANRRRVGSGRSCRYWT
ncbi:MAG: hypothetical protein GY910_11615 [bacterium]|nr:hypothetical protein [bacterium]